MSDKRQVTALIGGLLCLLVLGACGSGSSATTRTGQTTQDRSAALQQANANCKQMLHGVTRIAMRARKAAYETSLATVTEALAKPATRLIKQVAKRQRSLAQAINDSQFDLYVHLFDPIIVLAEERVKAGQVEDVARSEQLQKLLVNLGDEQRVAAQQAGLHACGVDFFAAMVRASGS